MITTAALTVAIAAALIPLIQRDLRIAHARIQARRRYLAMTPLQRAIMDAHRKVRMELKVFAVGIAAVGEAYRKVAAAERRRQREQALDHALPRRRRRRDRWSLR